jgi:hypothetical protein
MEAELSAWLRRLEPAGTPIALRLRTFADLHAEAERPRRRLYWPVPGLSSVAGLVAIVLGIGLITMFALATTRLSGTPGSEPTPTEELPASPQDLGALAVLIVVSCLAGIAVLHRRVRAAASWLAFGSGRTAAAAPLPLNQPWRSIPRLTLALGVLTVATIALIVWQYFTFPFWTPPGAEIAVAILLPSAIVAAPSALVVAWRYPRQDRSVRLLLLWALIELAIQLFFLAAVFIDALWSVWGLMELLPVSSMVAMVSLAAGLAGRSGSLCRPPLRFAALTVGGAFALSLYVPFQWLFTSASWADPNTWLLLLPGAESWIVLCAWASVVWVAGGAFRQDHVSWTWAAVLVAAVLQISWRLAGYLFDFEDFHAFFPGQWTPLMTLLYTWQVLATALAGTAMLVALLGGLRPVPQLPPEDVADA